MRRGYTVTVFEKNLFRRGFRRNRGLPVADTNGRRSCIRFGSQVIVTVRLITHIIIITLL